MSRKLLVLAMSCEQEFFKEEDMERVYLEVFETIDNLAKAKA